MVRDGQIETPLGNFDARAEMEDGDPASIVIRYEALRIEPDSSFGANAVVMEARLLGRASLIHLSVPTGTDELHLHARVPGLNSFGEGTQVRISVDAEQAFVFAAT